MLIVPTITVRDLHCSHLFDFRHNIFPFFESSRFETLYNVLTFISSLFLIQRGTYIDDIFFSRILLLLLRMVTKPERIVNRIHPSFLGESPYASSLVNFARMRDFVLESQYTRCYLWEDFTQTRLPQSFLSRLLFPYFTYSHRCNCKKLHTII